MHLSAPASPRRAAARNQELRELAARSAAVDGPLVVAGDFNITPYSPYFVDWLAASGLTDSRRGRTLSVSWPTTLPWLGIPIDHVAVNDGFTIVSHRRLAELRVRPLRRARRARAFARRGAAMSAQPTACVLIIGNEILSGKTQDTNLQFLGFELAKLGIRLAEGRVVRDEPAAIIRHLNETRREFTYVFTTGGIGPTHDDITAECVAQAFGVPLELNDDAVERLQRSGRPLNEARLKMARIPRGARARRQPHQQCARLSHRERVRVRGHSEHRARDVRERDPDARARRADSLGERRRISCAKATSPRR